MKSTVLGDKKVITALKNIHVLTIDISKQSAAQLKIMHYYNVIAPPTMIFIRDQQEITNSRIIGEVDAAALIKATHYAAKKDR